MYLVLDLEAVFSQSYLATNTFVYTYIAEIAKLLIFNGNANKIAGFMIAYKLYIRMKIRKVLVEEQIQSVLTYIYRENQWIFERKMFWKI